MNRLFKHIVRPNRIILLLYGLFSLVCLTAYVWIFSFVWEFVYSVTHFVVGLLFVLLTGLIIGLLIDKKFKWKLKRYFVISIIQLLCIWAISNPIRTWQIESSIEKAKLIIDPLENFKDQYGEYPKTLVELEEKMNQKIPRRSNIGTRYWYEPIKDGSYTLRFLSYYGYTAHYSIKKKEWVLID